LDADACEKCLALSEETWVTPDITGTLIHPSEGAVWDLTSDMPLTHPHCRCYLEVEAQIDLERTGLWSEVQMTFTGTGFLPSNIEETKEQLLDLDAAYDLTYKDIRQFESLLFRTISLMRRSGLSEDAQKAATIALRLISILRILQRSLYLLEMQGGPLGWALAGIGAASAIASGYDMLLEVSNR
jgi:hypothetical protein